VFTIRALTRHVPKDLFPLPRIDQVVDSTVGCETLCFLDVYSRYHQIAMYIVDQLANHITSSSLCMHLEVLCLCRKTWT
jgi:hypothetical protein